MTVNLGLGLQSVQSGNQSDLYALPALLPVPLLWFNPAKGGDGARLTDFGSLGIDATQPTPTSQPMSTSEINGKPTLTFDGSDDALSTGVLPLSSYSAITVCYVAKDNDGDLGLVMEYGPNVNVTDGTFVLSQNDGTASRYTTGLKGTSSVISTQTNASQPTTIVRADVLDLTQTVRDDEIDTRINGEAASVNWRTTTTHTGDGPFSDQVLYIGARAGTSFFAGMDLAEMIIFPGALSIAQIEAYEVSRGRLNPSEKIIKMSDETDPKKSSDAGPKHQTGQKASSSAESREERLSAALRANLKRRKSQARGRKSELDRDASGAP
eukprot:s1_g1073.t1